MIRTNTLSSLFADNTDCFTSGTNLPQVEEMLNLELPKTSIWLKVNKLPLHVIKVQLYASHQQKITQTMYIYWHGWTFHW